MKWQNVTLVLRSCWSGIELVGTSGYGTARMCQPNLDFFRSWIRTRRARVRRVFFSTRTERARPESNIQYVAQSEYDVRKNGNPKSIQSDVRDWCEHADHRDYRDYKRDDKYPHCWSVEFHGFPPLCHRPLGRSSFDGLHYNPPDMIHRTSGTYPQCCTGRARLRPFWKRQTAAAPTE